MAYRQNYDPTPGAQQPNLYPSVGQNYLKYGEQRAQGYIYNYADDRYYPSPSAMKTSLQAQGALPADPKQPSAWEQLAPIAGAGLVITGGQALGKQIPGYIKDAFSASKGGEAISSATKAGDLISASASPNVTAGIENAFPGGLPGLEQFTEGGGAIPTLSEGISGLAPEGGMFELGGIGSVGNAILPALGALGAYDVFTNDRGPVMGGLEGAASGAAIGSAFGGVGAIPGAAIGGVLGLGKGLLERESTKDMQKKRDNALLATDNPTFKSFIEQLHADADKNPQYHNGQVVASQPADFVGVDPTGGWVNNKFAASRNESDLTAKDIWGTDAFFEKYGNDWLGGFTPGQRESIAQQALDAGAVREHHGMVDVDWEKFTPSIPKAEKEKVTKKK